MVSRRAKLKACKPLKIRKALVLQLCVFLFPPVYLLLVFRFDLALCLFHRALQFPLQHLDFEARWIRACFLKPITSLVCGVALPTSSGSQRTIEIKLVRIFLPLFFFSHVYRIRAIEHPPIIELIIFLATQVDVVLHPVMPQVLLLFLHVHAIFLEQPLTLLLQPLFSILELYKWVSLLQFAFCSPQSPRVPEWGKSAPTFFVFYIIKHVVACTAIARPVRAGSSSSFSSSA